MSDKYHLCSSTRESLQRCPVERSEVPVFSGQGTPISHSKTEDAQICTLMDARNKAAMK